MKKLLLFLLLAFCAINLSAQETSIVIDLGRRGATVSPNLYGIFFEEINHAADGGLYAELVQNRGFEEHVLPSSMTYEGGRARAIDSPNYEHRNNRRWSIPWNLEEKQMLAWKVTGKGASVKGEVIEAKSPLHPNTPHAMQLTITKVGKGGKAILTNTGYWGMGLREGEQYDLRFYAKSADYVGDIIARISDADKGTTLAITTLKAKPIKDWTEFTATLTATTSTAHGQLSLEFGKKGTVLVDYVSLFPRHTFKERKNGLRADVTQMLVNMHPRFMRWPGGCIVEGATYENRFKWKETLGDPMTRRGEWDLWGYRATWGMGYHEFLQFCEDLGMDAMFVNNAGMSCSVRNGDFVSSDEEMEVVVQDFRDAIDYALADPATNEWARRRAEAGHPEPFPLKYVEIGNENVGPEYMKHFNYIFSKLQREYPRLTFINTLGHTDPLLEQIPGRYMVDPHWYRNPDFFFNNNHLFDRAPRTHDIYVGEYACNGGVGAGNLLAALSEAAFIMGMERNSDVVKMSSYAPLFENENHRDWPCNLIHINSTQVFGRASYYVQQMFSQNLPSYNVFVSETSTADEPVPFGKGSVGVGSYATQCEYKDIRLTTPDGKVREVPVGSLRERKGTWEKVGDAIRQTSDEQVTVAQLPDFSADTYTLELKARKIGGNEGFFIYYGLDESGRNGYAANIGGWNNMTTAVQPMLRGRVNDVLGRRTQQTIETDKWYDIRLDVSPLRTTVFVDGQQVTDATPTVQTRHFCQAGYDEKGGEVVIKVVNGTEAPYKRHFKITGSTEVATSGLVITLSGNANEENTFEQPTKIAPVTTTCEALGKEFDFEFQPMSFTVIRLKASIPRRSRWGFDAHHPDAHDPVMAKGEDGRYYVFSTGMGVGVMSSADLKEWRREPSALRDIPQWAADTVRGYRGHTWAPDISHHNGLWHLYYSCSTFGKNGSAIGHAVNKTLDPSSPDFGWQDQGMVIASHRHRDNWNAIDPNLIVDQKGQPYLVFGSFWDGIQLIRLSKKDFQTPETEPVTISRRIGRRLTLEEIDNVASYTIEGRDTIEAGPNAVEAPFIYYHDGYYYLFVSFDFCCRGANSTYNTVYGRSRKITGPYVDQKGRLMEHGGGIRLYGPDAANFGIGHCAVYDIDGQPTFVAHAYEKTRNGQAKLFVRPLTFDQDGWIVPTGGDFVKGADVGFLAGQERQGQRFQDRNGQQRDCLELLHDDYQLGAVRLRVWVNPRDGDCDKHQVLAMAKRAKALGMDIMIDFHYGDWWADPAKQPIPAAWLGHSYKQMKDDLRRHTIEVLTLLRDNGIQPRWVQVGNETTNGMLWSVKTDEHGWELKDQNGNTIITESMGHIKTQPRHYAGFIRTGYDAVKEVFPEALVIVHLDRGHRPDLYDWNLGILKRYGAKFDMVGMSLYPYWAMQDHPELNADQIITDCMANIRHVGEKFGCDVMIVETGYEVNEEKPEIMEEGRRQLSRVIREAQTETNGRCRGVFYWEPQCQPRSYKLGAFYSNGKPTAIMDGFLELSE